MALVPLLITWALFGLSNILLVASILMLAKAGPFAKKRIGFVPATGLFVIALTLLLVSGKQNLLQATITTLIGG